MIRNIDHANVVHYGSDSLIIRSTSNDNGHQACIKIINEEFPSPELIAQLENEFEICSKANSSSIRKALRKEKQDEHAALILEYIPGKDLSQFLADEHLEFGKQLKLALSIATALYELQKENIFHGQLHPSNIIIEKETGDPRLIDFGHATVGNVFGTSLQFSKEKEIDYLRYISPEQTGRINRPIDSRADLYSFGIILYQLFTGLMPFESDEALELIYSHVAKTAEEPKKVNRDLPQAVSDIIMMLLSKNAEDRYQSAFGIKDDLEKCLQQYELQKRINEFRLAAKDFSGKLYIQGKLYGREKELNYLNSLFSNCVNGKKSTLLLSGYSGSGKSALIESLLKPVSQKKGYFIKGKFDQISSDTPYSTFVQAFNELIKMILTGEDAYRLRWRKKIMDTMGGSVKILSQFIPGIEELTGKLPDIAVLKGVEAQNRFNYEFARFIKTIADKEHPLVIFVDDLQWADASSLSLVKIIAENRDIEYVMLIGAYRKNEVDENHPLVKKINELREENVSFEEMELDDLSFEDINNLVEGALHSSMDHTSFLSDIIYNKTKGNAFYTWQFLKSIYDERFLWFDFEKQHWQWNADLIMQMNVSGNVVDLMTDYVQKLPSEILSLLETASAIGNRFDKKTLAVVKDADDKKIQSQLNIAVSDGLLIPSGDEYKFAHDRVQQAIYSLIPEKEKTSLHLLNGKRLISYYGVNEQQERIFEIVNQWNLGAALLTDKKEKAYLGHLNLQAGKKAMASTAYPQALQYFEKGVAVLDENEWKDQYDFLLELYIYAAEAAYLSGEYDKVDKYVQPIIQRSQSLVDSVKGYEIEIKKLIAQNKLLEAIKLGLKVLNKLGIKLPMAPGRLSVLKDMLQTRWLLRNKTADYFNRLPEMEDEQKKAAMRIMSEISSASYFAVPNLVPLLVFKMVKMTAKHGLSVKSPFSFAAYGYILSAHVKQVNKGSRMGEIAVHLAKKINAEEVMASIIATSNLFLDHWKKPLPEISNDLEKAFKLSIEYGDNEYASYAAHNIIYHLFIAGSSLHTLSKKAAVLDLQIEKFKQDLTLKRLRLFRQAIDNILFSTDQPDLLQGNIYDESIMDIAEVTKENEIYFQNLYILKLYLALLFNNSEHAKKYIAHAEQFQETVTGTSLNPLFYFLRSLAIADSSVNTAVKRPILSQVKKDIKQLKRFEKLAPQYNAHKVLLLEAEYHCLKGEMETAKIYYDKALKVATENGMLNDVALCWERAGQFFLNTKQDLLADFYLQNAYNTYKRWGADAKLKQMEKRYTHLHSGKPIVWNSETTQETTSEWKGSLDMETVLKASSAISGEIVLPRLLRKMMQIISESAGAQTGYLIMEKKGERCIEAEIKAEDGSISVLQSLPAHRSGLLAESILNYVYLAKEKVIIDDAMKSQLFSNDDFIRHNECKSILCIPLMNMGRVQAVIYLSNDLTYGAFTENRVALLEVLASQMAISIENALFYNELENKVEERTNELYIEKKKSDDLLLNILPEVVAQELKQTGKTTPRSYEVATVMFTDFENFTVRSEKLSPEELVSMIDSCFKKFDEIISKHNIEKIKTIGDAYLCVSGLPDTKDHNAVNVINAAMEIIDVIKELKQSNTENGFFDIRIGIHTGPLVAGVVGSKKFAYDIWGDTVNTAARMEQNSEPNRINISQSTYELVKEKFNCRFRGKQPAKNKGLIEMYFIENGI
jgi:predicted ATPase/class 3 adenylate cyclase/tRNA A-37 threonylcarbamoyl transferase component Bud32